MKKVRRYLISFIFSFSLSIIITFSAFANSPKISIITSVYKGEQFIEGFMKDIVRQTVFDQCELIIINANSPENEESIVKKYQKKYPNIVYVCLEGDPGLYAVWNLAIEMAQGEYITNANVDDRLAFTCYEMHLVALEENKDVDLVYSGFLVTYKPNELFEKNSATHVNIGKPFSPEIMEHCQIGPNPMWRKSMHEKCGLFDEFYKHSGDWEMWCRAVAFGSRFLRATGYFCLYFLNPEGLSTDKKRDQVIKQEDEYIRRKYGYLWGSSKI